MKSYFNTPLEYCRFISFPGTDIEYQIQKESLRGKGVDTTGGLRFVSGVRYNGLLDRLVDAGRLGRKTGAVLALSIVIVLFTILLGWFYHFLTVPYTHRYIIVKFDKLFSD